MRKKRWAVEWRPDVRVLLGEPTILQELAEYAHEVRTTMTPDVALRWIRIVHTVVWFVFAASIVLIPLATYLNRWAMAFWLIGFVALEVIVLLVNRMRCPLTDIAGRYTADRRDNFDIYLPLWLARHNKTIFGTLYVVAVAYAVFRWVGLPG